MVRHFAVINKMGQVSDIKAIFLEEKLARNFFSSEIGSPLKTHRYEIARKNTATGLTATKKLRRGMRPAQQRPGAGPVRMPRRYLKIYEKKKQRKCPSEGFCL